MALIIRLFYVAYRASTPFSALIAVGVGGMLLFQTFMNIFMNVGLLPVMGLTLPFFSYGRYVHRYHVCRARHRRRRQNARKAKLAAKLIWASRPAHTLKMTEGICKMTRQQAWELLRRYNTEPFHLRHALTVEGVMRLFCRAARL